MSKRFGGLIPKILNGSKKIESRWSKNKVAPWNKVHTGDMVYFKDSGGPVVAKAAVEKAMQFEKTDFAQIKRYFGFPQEWFKDKNYCTLIFLTNPQAVQPFKINKTSFGSAAAWLCMGNIHQVKVQ